MKTIFVGSGHGRTDPGACANGQTEAALMVALRDAVVARLAASGAPVRTDGPGNLSLADAIRVALSCDGPRVELHMNAALDPGACGTEAIVARRNRAVAPLAADLAAATGTALGTRLRGRMGLVYMEDLGRMLGFCRQAGGVVLEVAFISHEGDLAKVLARQDALVAGLTEVLARYAR